jgi:O-antigen/teichoic acid export membrane protein
MNQLKHKAYTFLRWSERHTKTDMIYLTKGGFWLTLAQVISSASGLILAIAFANLLPKETYGTYKYVLSIIAILGVTTLSDMNTALTQAVARGYAGNYKHVLRICMRWGMIGGAGALGVSIYYFINGNTTLGIAFLVAGIFLPLMDPFAMYNSYLQGKKNFKLSSTLNIISRLVTTGLLIATIALSKNVFWLIISYFAGYTIVRYVSHRYVINHFPQSPEQDKSIISYGKHLSLMSILPTIAGQVDKILVFHYLGTAQLAIYSFATTLPDQVKIIFKNLNALAFPKMAAMDSATLKKSVISKTVRLMILSGSLTVLYIIAAPLLFQFFLPQYTASIGLSQIFALSILIHPAGLLLTALQSQKAKKELYLFNTYSPIAQIAILFICLSYFGLVGLIAARVLIRVMNALISLLLVLRVKDSAPVSQISVG